MRVVRVEEALIDPSERSASVLGPQRPAAAGLDRGADAVEVMLPAVVRRLEPCQDASTGRRRRPCPPLARMTARRGSFDEPARTVRSADPDAEVGLHLT